MKKFVYKGRKTGAISFPLGGIGTGCIGLSGNGRLVDWEIAGRPSKGSLNGFSHFAVRAERDGKVLDARVLQGDLHPHYMGEFGKPHCFHGYGWGPQRENMAGVPHFREVEFNGEFPFAELAFKGSAFPGKVKMTAFNPFIPLNDKDSGIPAAFFDISITNPTRKQITYSVIGALGNPLKANNLHRFSRAGGLSRLHLASDGYDEKEFGAGDLTLATDAKDVSHQCYWFGGAWFDNLEVYWREMMTPGPFKNRTYTPAVAGSGNTGMLASRISAAPGRTVHVRYVIAWSYRWAMCYWNDTAARRAEAAKRGVPWMWRHYYATQWKDSRDSAGYALKHWDRTLAETRMFKDSVYASDLPREAIEAVSANLAILKTATVLRLEDGTLYGWEGVGCDAGCCEGSCTHVWNYAQAFPFLFPKLERSMRTANYRYNQDKHGGMHFRIMLPLGIGRISMFCADGQFGDIMKTYRDWKVSGDTGWLRTLWPAVKKSIEFAWSPDNPHRWDPDKTGVLQGRQHHTLDMELFGPNSWLTGFYLGGLKAAAEMADALGEPDTADEYRALFAKGKAWTDENLFNGEYYHQIVDLKDKSIAERFDAMQYWNDEHKELKYQIGEGSEIDQIVAQWHANLYGLGEIFDPAQVRTTLKSLFKNNFRPEMREYFNACRVYALNDEGGLVVCHWPEGKYRPICPLPYSGETQNGYEWAAIVQMIQGGLVKNAMKALVALRSRYDGEKRNPWNEFECGNNYARSMASYSLLNAFSGFQFDMTRGFVGFKPVVAGTRKFRCFWSLDSGWGEIRLDRSKAELVVLHGKLTVSELSLPITPGTIKIGRKNVRFTVEEGRIKLRNPVTINAGTPLRVG